MSSEYATWHRELTQPKPTIAARVARWFDRSHEPPRHHPREAVSGNVRLALC